ncbi:MAG TPA: hypothetical protein VGC55_09220 [Dokdonella sp.]
MARATTPGTPGTPQAATPIFIENFQNTTTPTWIRLDTYAPDIPGTGSTPNLPPKPAAETYAAAAPWLTACNGIVLNFNTTQASRPPECSDGTFGPWSELRQMAQALGEVAGMSQAAARDNYAITAYTQANPGANAIEFQTTTNIPFSAASTRFITFSVDSAAVSCVNPVTAGSAQHPQLQFALINGVGGAPTNVGGILDACAVGTPTQPVEAVAPNPVQNINAARFFTNASYPFTGTSIGVVMKNAQGSGVGNDAAFDNIQVFDSTPQLDKAFDPPVIAPGATSVLTFTVTNTTDLASKTGFSFTDALPAGLVVAATPGFVSTCTTPTQSGATAGSTVVTFGGSLAAGVASCAFNVNVTSSTAGTYINGPSNITASVGLNPPAPATLLVSASSFASTCAAAPVVYVSSANPTTQLFQQTQGSGAATFTPVGGLSGWSYNAIAMNPADDFIYAVSVTIGDPLHPLNHLLVVDSGGNVTDLGAIAGLIGLDTGVGLNAGAFDNAGAFWVMASLSAGSGGEGFLYKLDLSTRVATKLVPNQPGSVNTNDLTYASGFMWGLQSVAAGTAPQLYRINLGNGQTDLFAQSVIPAPAVDTIYGAAWTYGSGNLGFASNIPGHTYQVGISNPATTPLLTLVDDFDSPASSGNDGTVCPALPVDLSISKTGPASALAGSAISWTLTVTNNSAASGSSGFVVADAVPAGFTAVSTPTPGCTVAGNDVQCSGGALAAGASTTITINATTPVPFTAPIINTATVTGNEQDPNLANNTATQTIVPAPQLTVTKTATPTQFIVGQPGSYSIVVQNTGSGPSTGNITLTDLLPAGINYVAATGANWSCTSPPALSCTFTGTLAVGASTTLILDVTVSPGTTRADNSATASGGGDPTCPAAGHCTGTVIVPVSTIADLAISKTDGAATYTPGNPITYTIVASNAGPSDAIGATVADTLPATITGATWTVAYSIGASGPAGGSGSINATVTIPAGGTATFTVTGTISASATGTLVNTATVTAPGGTTDPVPGNNSATDSDAQGAQLTVVKSATPNPFVVGQSASYAITVTNSGGTPTSAPIAITDTLPAGITLATFSGANWSCTGTTALNCTFSGTLAAGASTTLSLNVDVAASAANGNNAATASGGGDPSCPAATHCVGTVVVPVTPAADIAVLKTVDNGAPNVGEQVTFTITATNNGPSDATGVQITDALPSGLVFVSATPSQGAYDNASGLWSAGALANGASATLQITATVIATGTLTNTATRTGGDQLDPNPSNNSASASVNGQPSADIQVLKTVDAATPNVGSNATFTITATNAGPDDATGVVLGDVLPSGLVFVSATPSQGTFDDPSGDWTIGDIANGASVTLTITATVMQAGDITNIASVTASNQFDPNPSNNSAGVTINGQSADIQVVKTVDDANPTVGDTITFTIVTTNNGPDAATAVEVTETLPGQLTLVSATPSAGTYDNATGVWTIGGLDATGAGATVTLTIVATVNTEGAFTNTVTVTGSDQPDPNPANNTSTVPILGNDSADLAVVKTGPASATPGANVSYTLSVTNQGPSTATAATLDDPTPAGLAFVSATAPCTGGFPCALGDLAAAANVIVTVTFSLPPDYTGPLVNTATTTSTTTDPDPTNNSSTVTTPLAPEADLVVLKTGPATVSTTGAISYTVVVSNNGPSDADGALFSDPLPAGIGAVSASCAAPGGGAVCGPVAVAGTVVTSTITTLPAGGSVTFTISGIAPGAPATLTNTASVQPPAGVDDPNPANNSSSVDTAVVAVTGSADLAIVKTGPATIAAGGTITYTLAIGNGGPDAADGASYSDAVPAGITGVTASCGGEGGGALCGTQPTVTGNTVSGAIGSLPNGGSAIVTISGIAPAGATTLSNTGTVAPPGGTTDPNPANNTSSVTTLVQGPNLLDPPFISKSVTAIDANTLLWQIVLINNQNALALPVELRDPLPAGMNFVSGQITCQASGASTISGCAFDAANNRIVADALIQPDPGVTDPTLAANDVVVSFQAQYTSTPAAVTNTAAAYWDQNNDGSVGDDIAGGQTPVNASATYTPVVGTASADLAVIKTGPASANAGDTVSYTIAVVNNGPDAAPDAVLTDPTPAGLTYVSSTAPCASGFPCALPALASGASASVAVTYAVQAGYSGTLVNVASANSPTVPDPTPDNNSSTVRTQVSGSPPDEITPVPVDARWMLALTTLLLMLIGAPRALRRR